MASSIEFLTWNPQAVAPATAKDYFELLKPRVMSLVIFTAWVGLMLAPGSLHPFMSFIAILCIAAGAGASGALNMWYDRDIDAIMQRTRRRPLPQGRMNPESALSFGTVLAMGSVLIMGLVVNWFAAGLLAFSIFFYVFIYTMWLKRRTPQNIVIGGAAGALPPMIGWAAISGDMSWQSLVLFLIIFMWTPPHFWALALYRSEDYAAAKVPMLPVTSGLKSTRWHIVIYSFLLVPITLLPYTLKMVGQLYLFSVSLLGAIFLTLSLLILITQKERFARQLFAYSIFYLFAIFLLLLMDTAS